MAVLKLNNIAIICFMIAVNSIRGEFPQPFPVVNPNPALFVDFGPHVDQQIPISDDGSTGLFTISTEFPFFDNLYDSLFVSVNGAIGPREIGTYTLKPFPLHNGVEMIAPFWADVDLRTNGGRIYYREAIADTEADEDCQRRATIDVKDAFPTLTDYAAKWCFVVTWYRVTFYGVKSTPPPENTFQVLLSTDGKRSFVSFIYGDITWTTGRASDGNEMTGLGGKPAQVGFNAGDGINHFSIPGSYTDDIVNIEKTSNVGTPGKWVFRVDNSDIQDPTCSSNVDRIITEGPRFSSFLGGKEITISGPCLDYHDQIICDFGGKKVQGKLGNKHSAKCVAPFRGELGNVELKISLDDGITTPGLLASYSHIHIQIIWTRELSEPL